MKRPYFNFKSRGQPSFYSFTPSHMVKLTEIACEVNSMKTAIQFTFTTYAASLKLKPNDPTKIIFDNITGLLSIPWLYDPISLFKAQLLIYLGEVSSDHKLAPTSRHNGRLCLLCGFTFLKIPQTASICSSAGLALSAWNDLFIKCNHDSCASFRSIMSFH